MRRGILVRAGGVGRAGVHVLARVRLRGVALVRGWRVVRSGGQASVELLGAVPVLLVLGLFLFQVLAVGYSAVLAGNAAEAGALSLAGGGDAEDAARDALPGWSRAGMDVGVDGGRVEVSLRPPSPLHALTERLEVSSTAAVRAPRR